MAAASQEEEVDKCPKTCLLQWTQNSLIISPNGLCLERWLHIHRALFKLEELHSYLDNKSVLRFPKQENVATATCLTNI